MALIEINQLTKSFNNLEVLKGIDLSIEENQVVSIIGASGSGKSTLLRCINLLENYDSGTIIYQGNNILEHGYDVRNYRSKVNMVFQNFNLFNNMTVLQNCMFAPMKVLKKDKTEAQEKALELLKKVGLEAFANSSVNILSGGQKQRVAIARSLAMDPNVILFDEPTSALDPLMVNEVLQVIQSVAKGGITMVIVTHEMQFAHDVSDKIVFMHQGVIEAQGSSDYIFNKCDNVNLNQFLARYRLTLHS